MLQFDIITIFPELFRDFVKESLIKKAQGKKLIKISIHNLRDFTNDKHEVVDDKPYGGGRGMVMMIEPIYKAISKIKKKNKKTRIVLLSPRGKKLNQKKVYDFAKYDQIIFVCGRYEGIDERVLKFVDEIISIGDYVLMGGEVPAMVIMEAVSRLIPDVIGKSEDLIKTRVNKKQGEYIEFPQYTRPEIFKTKESKQLKVPKVLTSGNHKKIKEWRKEKQKIIK